MFPQPTGNNSGFPGSSNPNLSQSAPDKPLFSQTSFGQTSADNTVKTPSVFQHQSTSAQSTFGTHSGFSFSGSGSSQPQSGIFGQISSNPLSKTSGFQVGPGINTPGLFGTGVTAQGQSGFPGNTASAQPIFGSYNLEPASGRFSGNTQDTSANPFAGQKSENLQTLFGKPISSVSDGKISFGSDKVGESSGLFPSDSSTSHASVEITRTSQVLFGKPFSTESRVGGKERESKVPYLFAKSGTEKPTDIAYSTKTVSDSGLFGKPREQGVLFGAASEKTDRFGSGKSIIRRRTSPDCESVSYDRPHDAEDSHLRPRISRRQPEPDDRGKSIIKRPAVQKTGLFGKALRDVTPGPPSESSPEKSQPGDDGVGETSSAAVRYRRRSSLDDLTRKVAIVCRNIPVSANNKLSLRTHFSKFGRITKLFVTPSKGSAIIHFADHESAANAKRMGKIIKPGARPMQIFFSNYSGPATSPKVASTTETSEESPVRPLRRSSLDAPRRDLRSRTRTSPSRKRPLQSQLDDELSSMMGTQDTIRELGSPERHRDRHEDTRKELGSPERHRGRPEDTRRELGSPERHRDRHEDTRKELGSPERHRGRPEDTRRELGSPERHRDRHENTTRELVSPEKHRRDKSREPEIQPRQQPKAPAETKREKASSRTFAKSVSNSSAARYEVLDQKDKMIRAALGEQKRADLATTKVMVGTCPDMCPEKERYCREYRKLLSSFEVIPGTDQVDHSRAVKEYSRSSADQDMPLSHELRPPAVLDMTMTYLLNNIMDLGEDSNSAEWFDFLWNRTRGIRKDMTQQQMSDLTAVGLTEKCTRFHIYCAHRLSEEDPSVFDQKINDENLTKCLQTLKELYPELRSKHEVTCPCEPEFRAYMVLMNLNQGDILREVQQLENDVRESPEVRFVVQVYSALNNNNYIRFFKLLQHASFLMACIMHRYFNQMRNRALRVVLKTHGAPGKRSGYRLSELVRLLAFEDENEAGDFCMHHGLQLAKGQVRMDKQQFIHPEMLFPLRRAVNMIESKKLFSAGQVVNGGPLPANIIHVPENSFTDTGQYVGQEPPETQKPKQAISAATIAETAPRQDARQDSQPPELKTPQYTNDAIKDIARKLFLGVIDEFCLKMATDVVKAKDAYFKMDVIIFDEILNEVLDTSKLEVIREVLQEALIVEDERLAQAEAERQARERAEVSAAKARACQDVADIILEDTVDTLCQDVALHRYRSVQKELEEKSVARSTLNVADSLVDAIVEQQVRELANHVYEVDVKQRLRKLHQNERAVHTLVVRRFWQRWKNMHAGRLRLKRSIYNFPAAPPMRPLEATVKAVLPDSKGISNNTLHLGKNARSTLTSPADVLASRHRLQLHLAIDGCVNWLKHKAAWEPVNLVKIIANHLKERQTGDESNPRYWAGKRYFWKLLVCVPESDSRESQAVPDWLKAKLARGAVPNPELGGKTEVWSLYTTEEHYIPYSICIRAVRGTLEGEEIETVQEKHCLLGCSAVIFLSTPWSDHQDSQEFWSGERARLFSLLQAKSEHPGIPLVVLTTATGATVTSDDIAAYLDLEQFQNDQLISQYLIISLGADVEKTKATQSLVRSLQWLTERSQSPPHLQSRPLNHLLEDVLSQRFSMRVYQDLAKRRKADLLHQSPEVLLDLYKSVIDYVAAMVTSPALRILSWPVAEFANDTEIDLPAPGWNSPRQFDFWMEILHSLVLPPFEYHHLRSENWKDACADVWNYVATVVEGDSGYNGPQLFSRIRLILQKAKRGFQDRCWTEHRLRACSPCYVNMPWTDVIMSCVDYKVSELNHIHPSYQQTDPDLMVHFLSDQCAPYQLPETWSDAVLEREDSVKLDDTLARSVKRKCDDATRGSPPKSRRFEPDEPSNNLPEEGDADDSELGEDLYRLKRTIMQEKKSSEKYEEYLTRALIDGELLHTESGSFRIMEGSTPIAPKYSTPDIRQQSSDGSTNSLNLCTPPLSVVSRGSTRSTRSLRPHSPDVELSELELLDLEFRDQKMCLLAEKLKVLKSKIASEKQADRIFEMKLQSLLSDPL